MRNIKPDAMRILAEVSMEENDGDVGNWIMAIVCLLAWLKGGK